MANQPLQVQINEIGNLQAIPASSSGNRIELVRGDTLTIDNIGFSGTITVGTFTSAIWSPSGSAALDPATSPVVKTVISTATLGDTTLTISSPGKNSITVYFTILDSLDTTPDQFDLGPAVSGVSPGVYQYSAVATISGINTNITATVSGGEMSVNGGPYFSGTASNIYNNSKIRVRVLSSQTHGASVTATLTAGGVSDTFTATTYSQPPAGQIIPLGITTGLIKLSDIKSFFGGVVSGLGTPPNNLKSYYRNGSLVPNLTVNNAVPTSGDIALTDFYGSGTEFYISSIPGSKNAGQSTLSGSVTIEVQWTIGTDWDVGWGNYAKQASQYHYTMTVTNASGAGAATGDVVLERGYTSYHALNTYVRAKVTVPANSDRQYNGYIDFYARHSYDTSKVVTARAYFFLSAYGP